MDTSNRDAYQKVYLKGDAVTGGARTDKRIKMIPWKLIENKTILDLGCNNGMLSIEAAKRGALSVLGVERSKAALMARETIVHEKLENIQIWQIDIESSEFINFTTTNFNIIFFCAMLNHMKKKQRMLEWIDLHCNEYLIYETNFENKVEKHKNFILENTSFTSCKFLGMSGDRKPEDYNLFLFSRNEHEKGDINKNKPIIFIPIEKIKLGVSSVNDFKGKKYDGERIKVDKLKESIIRNGLREPLWVIKVKDFFRIKEGGHRFLAMKELDYKDVAVRIIG